MRKREAHGCMIISSTDDTEHEVFRDGSSIGVGSTLAEAIQIAKRSAREDDREDIVSRMGTYEIDWCFGFWRVVEEGREIVQVKELSIEVPTKYVGKSEGQGVCVATGSLSTQGTEGVITSHSTHSELPESG